MELIPENIKINKPGKKIIAVFVGFFVISIVEIFIWPSMTFLPFWDLTPVDSIDPIWLFYPIQSPDFILWMQQFTSFCHFDFKLINKYFILYILFKFWRTVWSKLIQEFESKFLLVQVQIEPFSSLQVFTYGMSHTVCGIPVIIPTWSVDTWLGRFVALTFASSSFGLTSVFTLTIVIAYNKCIVRKFTWPWSRFTHFQFSNKRLKETSLTIFTSKKYPVQK